MKKNLDFESAIKRLDLVVKKLENDDVSLEESLKLFEEGVSLTNFCNNTLDDAEQKVSILTKQNGQDISEKEFDLGE